MLIAFLWLGLLAHILSDCILQTEKIQKSKYRLEYGGFLAHGTIIFICSFFTIHIYGLKTAFFYSFFTTLSHLTLDWVKIRFKFNSLAGLTVDQLVHLTIIIFLWNSLTISIDQGIAAFYTSLLSSEKMMILKEVFKFVFPLNQTLAIITVYLYVLFAGSVFIKTTLASIMPEKKEQRNNYNIEGSQIIFSQKRTDPGKIGRYIGIFERAIILTLVLYSSWSAIGFVLAAKSIARFSELNDKIFAEYYLIGTLISALVAISGGILLRNILS